MLGALTSSDSIKSFGMVGTTLPPAMVLKLCDAIHNLTALDLTSSYIGLKGGLIIAEALSKRVSRSSATVAKSITTNFISFE